MKWFLSFALIFVLAPFVSAQQLGGTVNGDGKVVISGTQDLIGVELKSPGGYLIPSDNPDSSGFQLVIANTTTEIVFGNLGTSDVVNLDGSMVLDAGYASSSPATFDLEGTWGGPLRDQEGPINFTAPVPEPSPALMAFTALGLLVAFRRRRSV